MNSEKFAADKTALLIVDPYNDFMSEGGKLYDAIKDTALAVNCFEHMRQLIAVARRERIQIFVVPHHRAKPDDYAGWQAITGPQSQTKAKQVFAAGTWGGEWNDEFGPKAGDVIIQEHW